MTTVPTLHVAASTRPGAAAIALGIPMPRGAADQDSRFVGRPVRGGSDVPLQTRVLSLWPDCSIKWMLASALLPAELVAIGTSVALVAGCGAAGDYGIGAADTLRVDVDGGTGGVAVSTGAARFNFAATGPTWLHVDDSGIDNPVDDGRTVSVSYRGAARPMCVGQVESVRVEEAGPVRAVVVQQGRFPGGVPLEILMRWSLTVGSDAALLEIRVRNPQAAQHHGGQWDLGDPGSVMIGDLSVEIDQGAAVEAIEWRETPDSPVAKSTSRHWTLYQDSSGGDRWDSPNHLDAGGRLGVSVPGYTVRIDSDASVASTPAGRRAQPVACLVGTTRRTAVGLQDFWQNFPKALRVRGGVLSVGLFPAERVRPTELQGGEQKRHRIAIGFGADATASVDALMTPVHAWVDPDWVEASAAVSGFVADLGADLAWNTHVHTIVDGPDSFAERRETIDEYGWRHFGELWADHEAVFDKGPEPFVSHYNNQYDFVFAAGLHALHTGDARWARLARETADHTADIDVYHTNADRPAFNGGLFWHTDHYRPARTSTHRTYSRANAAGKDYGGGPSAEHCYTSGLLLHHFRTGDADALEAVIAQADWLIAADDGSTTLLGAIDPGPTGLVSFTLDLDYHGPGRGAGNAISALLDGYTATGARRYLVKAEELVQRCIHPADDIVLRRLDEPEYRWSYLVFLQVLGKYLALKQELGEQDYLFHYARHSLLHYADWMLANEKPYKDLFHKVELPTETWPAHDMRKCHVMHLAARYEDRGQSDGFRAAAAMYHDRSLEDLEAFATKHLTRPLVILAAYGHLHTYYQRLAPVSEAVVARWRHHHDFGKPVPFLRQRDRVGATLRGRVAVVRGEVTRMLRDRVGRWRASRRAAAGQPGDAR